MKNIDAILEEIFNIDPSLKNKETEIRKTINAMLESKPEVTVDENFVTGLRDKLVQKTSSAAASPQSASRPLNIFKMRIAGAVMAAFIALVAAPLVYFYAIKTGGNGTTATPAVKRSDGTVVEKTDKGVVTKRQKTGKVVSGFVRFESQEEYKKYLASAERGYYGGGFGGVIARDEAVSMLSAPQAAGKTAAPERVSGTNVQVAGIDEPDILKTGGGEIYFSPRERYYYGRGIMPSPLHVEGSETGVDSVGTIPEEKIMPPEYNKAETRVIKAFPADGLSEDATIDKAGKLLLSDSTLVIFEARNIYGYDVSNPKKPAEKWNVEFDERNSFVQARMYGGKIYIVTRTNANRYEPCPVPLFKTGGEEITIRCGNIYHPIESIPVNAAYHISTINPADGKLTEGISFVGSYNSTIYMSTNGIYVAYARQGDLLKIMHGFLSKNSDLVSSDVINGIAKLMAYDISNSSKMREFEILLQDYTRSLDKDDALKMQNEMSNRAHDYFKKHKRELTLTDIVKINAGTLKADAMGTIPGNLLNQFSMDEYNGNLRAATTVSGAGFFGLGFRGSREQENDVYVLDSELSKIGSVQGLGEDERIYSARFIGNRGYLVTFRQTDPFFVLDLSDPKDPKVTGELKIPGYSSYLHPISKDKILGVGKEGASVKVSLFDVSDASNPKEVSKFTLQEYWSDILNTHHAFLLDGKFKVFFMPGSKGGYVFSYENNTLSIKKAVSGIRAKRAVFMDDNLYVVGDDKIVVLDENTWKRAGELSL